MFGLIMINLLWFIAILALSYQVRLVVPVQTQ
jgi:hypothetical protein